MNRQRYQHDAIFAADTSARIDGAAIAANAALGRLRKQDDGNLWGSKLPGSNLHAPIIDIDRPHTYVESKTPGHGHLYLHVPCSSSDYQAFLEAAASIGLTGLGNVMQYRTLGESFATADNPARIAAGQTPIEWF